MPYLNCGRCGLAIRIQADFMAIANCPRCLARAAIASPMALSSERVMPAVGFGVPPTDRARQPAEGQRAQRA